MSFAFQTVLTTHRLKGLARPVDASLHAAAQGLRYREGALLRAPY
jgi:hypothetical protein